MARPDRDRIKINCDASWCRQTKDDGIGVIARDSVVHVVGGVNRRLKGGDAAYLEAEGVLLSVRLSI